MSYHVFIVDDDRETRRMLGEFVGGLGHEVHTFANGREALEGAAVCTPDLVLLDVNLPDISGIAVLEKLRAMHAALHCVMITGEFSSKNVVESMRHGASDFLIKPINLEQLRLVVDKVRREIRDRMQMELLQKQQGDGRFSTIISTSHAMKRALDATAKVAASTANTVLIRGETGTGKELFARALHFNSPRATEPFIEVNCSAIPPQLLESELFGHEKGSFTDAKERKIGLLERAHGGTFFLDEIGDMDFNLQAKILRVLEERAVRRVGGDRLIPVDIRFVAATHKNLDDMIQQHVFREDLYFRLSVIVLDLPPLREREEDVAVLAEYFLKRFCREHARTIKGFTPQALQAMRSYPWPGNVRELRNAVERAVLIEADDWVDTEHLRLYRRRATREGGNGDGAPRQRIGYDFEIPESGFSLDEFERILLARAMKQTRYNVSKAARLLGLSRETMRYRIKKHELSLD
jgi:DNA-binding NtrC family response regulator